MLVDILSRHFASHREELDALRKIKSRSDRVDSLTLIVGDAYLLCGVRRLDGNLVFFDGRSYVPVRGEMLAAATRGVLMGLGVSPTDLRSMGFMAVDVLSNSDMPSDRSLLCFDNCVYDLRADEMRGFSPDLRVVERIPYRFLPNSPCPLWTAFLEWALPDEGQRMALQEFAGLAYIDRSVVSVEKFAVLVGSGANGKSVFTRVLTAALGEERVSNLDPSQLCNEKMVPYLQGMRMNVSPDVRASASFDSALKALSSGQAITGRRIYGEAEKVSAPPILFALNEMPFFRDTTEGFFRRLLIFTFSRTVPPERQDRQLAARIIRDELPGVMWWILQGRDRLMAHGGDFTRSSVMDDALAGIKAASRGGGTPLTDWLSDNGYSLTDGEPVLVSANDVFDGLHGLMTKSAVTREMERLGVECRRSGAGMHYRLFEKNI